MPSREFSLWRPSQHLRPADAPAVLLSSIKPVLSQPLPPWPGQQIPGRPQSPGLLPRLHRGCLKRVQRQASPASDVTCSAA